jgi:anti-sigma factor RsiW
MRDETSPPAPAELSDCLAPEVGRLVFDYVNGMLPEEEEANFEEHLFCCDTCYRMTAALDWAHETLRSKSGKAKVTKTARAAVFGSDPSNHTNRAETGAPQGSSPAFYLLIGGLSVLSLVALGVFGFNKISKLRHSLQTRREAAPS